MQNKAEKILMPIATKLGNNVVLRSLRDGFLIITPLIIVTSFFLLIGNFPIPGWSEFWTGILGSHWSEWFSSVSNSVFSFTGLLGCFGISYAYAKNRGLQAVNASAVAIISFLILTPTTLTVVRKLLVQLKLFILDLMEFFWGFLLP